MIDVEDHHAPDCRMMNITILSVTTTTTAQQSSASITFISTIQKCARHTRCNVIHSPTATRTHGATGIALGRRPRTVHGEVIVVMAWDALTDGTLSPILGTGD